MNHPLKLSTYPRITETDIVRHSNELVLIGGFYYYKRIIDSKSSDKYFSLLSKKIIEKDPYYRPYECKDNSEYYRLLDGDLGNFINELLGASSGVSYAVKNDLNDILGLPIQANSSIMVESHLSFDSSMVHIQYNAEIYTVNLFDLLKSFEYFDFKKKE